MDDQRLTSALRAGPPFLRPYVARPLALEPEPFAPGLVRWAVVVTLAALILAAAVAIVVIGALWPRLTLSAFTCGDAAESTGRDATGWATGWPAIGVADARAGLGAALGVQAGVSIIDPENGAVCAFVPADGEIGSAPVWAPGGAALAWVVGGSNGDGPYDLHVLSTNGLVRSALRSTLPFTIAWSPDGTSIAAVTSFTRTAGTHVDAWVIAADGSAPRQLDLDCARCLLEDGVAQGWSRALAWSPDGSKVAMVFRPKTVRQTFFYQAPDGLWVGVVSRGRFEEVADLRELAFASWLDDDTILAHDPDGRAVAISASTGATFEAPAGARAVEISEAGTLSPDGRLRTYVTEHGEVVVANVADGSRRRYLLGEQYSFAVAIWAPDSQSIAVRDLIVDAETGETRELSFTDAILAAWQPVRSFP